MIDIKPKLFIKIAFNESPSSHRELTFRSYMSTKALTWRFYNWSFGGKVAGKAKRGCRHLWASEKYYKKFKQKSRCPYNVTSTITYSIFQKEGASHGTMVLYGPKWNSIQEKILNDPFHNSIQNCKKSGTSFHLNYANLCKDYAY